MSLAAIEFLQIILHGSCEHSNGDFALLRIINVIINVVPRLYLKVSFVALCGCIKVFCNEDEK